MGCNRLAVAELQNYNWNMYLSTKKIAFFLFFGRECSYGRIFRAWRDRPVRSRENAVGPLSNLQKLRQRLVFLEHGATAGALALKAGQKKQRLFRRALPNSE